MHAHDSSIIKQLDCMKRGSLMHMCLSACNSHGSGRIVSSSGIFTPSRQIKRINDTVLVHGRPNSAGHKRFREKFQQKKPEDRGWLDDVDTKGALLLMRQSFEYKLRERTQS